MKGENANAVRLLSDRWSQASQCSALSVHKLHSNSLQIPLIHYHYCYFDAEQLKASGRDYRLVNGIPSIHSPRNLIEPAWQCGL